MSKIQVSLKKTFNLYSGLILCIDLRLNLIKLLAKCELIVTNKQQWHAYLKKEKENKLT